MEITQNYPSCQFGMENRKETKMELASQIPSYTDPVLAAAGLKAIRAKRSGGLTTVSVRDFKAYIQLIAKYDLWDEMEAQLASDGCTKFLIGRKPMRAVGLALREKVLIGDLPGDSPALAACDGCNPPKDNTADAGTGTGGGVMKEGETRPDPKGHPK
jgi:hypothetical protein